ncbi:MAG TPA: hypothetical protein VKR32_02100 [Puia sp.]|nr:hypothetical protein [Puia sp.]
MRPDTNDNSRDPVDFLTIEIEELKQQIELIGHDGSTYNNSLDRLEKIHDLIKSSFRPIFILKGVTERIEKIYTSLELIATNEAKSFSNSGKANLRKSQAEIQRIRLLLYDLMGISPHRDND